MDCMTEVLRIAVNADSGVIDARRIWVCARHGEPVADRWDEDVLGHPMSRWQLLRPTSDRLGKTAEHINSTVRISTRGWPMCPTCLAVVRRRSLQSRTVMGIGAAGMVVAVVIAVVVGPNPWLTVPFLGGAGLLVASLFLAGRTSMSALTGAHAALDGSAVLIDDPHSLFRAAVDAVSP